jgi:hypothetical protein
LIFQSITAADSIGAMSSFRNRQRRTLAGNSCYPELRLAKTDFLGSPRDVRVIYEVENQ